MRIQIRMASTAAANAGATQQNGRTLRKYVECVTNYAKEIAFLLVLF